MYNKLKEISLCISPSVTLNESQLLSPLEESFTAFVTLSCNFLMCFFKSKFRQKPLPQVPQVNGFLSLWVCMWKVRL